MRLRIAIAISAVLVMLCAGGPLRAQDAPTPAPPADKPDAAATPAPKPIATRIRIGGNVAAAQMTHQVQPKYPKEAKQKHISGTVILHAVIARDGHVQELQYISGPPLLMRSAMDAVRQWRYKPTKLQGEPVEVDTTISIVYTLSD